VKKEKISFHGSERLREERERLGFTQEFIAEQWGISRVTWGKYERGDSTPGAEVLAALAAAGADVLYILTGQRAVPVVSRKKQILLSHFDACDEDGQDAMIHVGVVASKPTAKKASG
jgi:transcriptional regulator with XRE-family HTH domain